VLDVIVRRWMLLPPFGRVIPFLIIWSAAAESLQVTGTWRLLANLVMVWLVLAVARLQRRSDITQESLAKLDSVRATIRQRIPETARLQDPSGEVHDRQPLSRPPKKRPTWRRAADPPARPAQLSIPPTDATTR